MRGDEGRRSGEETRREEWVRREVKKREEEQRRREEGIRWNEIKGRDREKRSGGEEKDLVGDELKKITFNYFIPANMKKCISFYLFKR